MDPAEWLIPVVFGLTAATVGIVAGISPIAAIAASVAIALALVALANLTAGLVGFVALSFLELVPSLTGPALSLAKLAGAILAVSWLASAAAFGTRRREFPEVHPGLMFAFVLLLGWNSASFSWAEDPGRIPVATASFLLNMALFPIVFAAIRNKRSVWLVYGAFVAGATFAALYGYVTQPSASALASSPTAANGLNRLAGTVADPNEFATLLVAGMALASPFVFSRDRPAPAKLLAGLSVAFLLFAVLLTLSRGGLIALSAALLVGIFVAYRARLRVLVATGLVVLGAVIYFSSNPQAFERVTASDGGSGRTDIWNIGWRMVEDHPVRGVGAANFQVSSIHYLLEPGAIRFDEYVVDQPAVAHNMYLQVLAELGIVGLVLFLGIVFVCIAMMVRAYLMFARADDRDGALLAAGALMAVSAVLAGYFFLSEEHSKVLWLLLTLGPTLLALARRDTQGADDPA
jgi:O-antigen ligase